MKGHIYPYRQIADDLRQQILNGDYPPGSRLPTREELQLQYRVAGCTVSNAMRILKDQGYVLARQGSGYFAAMPSSAAPPPPTLGVGVYARFEEWFNGDRHADACQKRIHGSCCGGPCDCGMDSIVSALRDIVNAHRVCEGRCLEMRTLAKNLLGDA